MAARQAARAEVAVPVTQAETFAYFTEDVGLSVRIEPGVGGRFIEVNDLASGGSGMKVGRVTVWEPGRRLVLTWRQVGWPEGAVTELKITFAPTDAGTLVRLEHRGFQRVPGALDFLAGYDAGWKEVLGWVRRARHRTHGLTTHPLPQTTIERSLTCAFFTDPEGHLVGRSEGAAQ